MSASNEHNSLSHVLRLNPEQEQAALQNGYVAREHYRGGHRYRLRLRVGGRLIARNLGRRRPDAERVERLLEQAGHQQTLTDISNARQSLRLAKRLCRDLHEANKARGRPAREPIDVNAEGPESFHKAGHNLSTKEKQKMVADLGQSDDDEVVDQGEEGDRDDQQPEEVPDDDDVGDITQREPIPEIVEAEWAYTADSAQGDGIVSEMPDAPDVGDAPSVVAEPEQLPGETEQLPQVEVKRHQALIRLDEEDDQAVNNMGAEEWLDQRLRHKSKELALAIVCGCAEKISASSDPIATTKEIERPVQLASKLLKEINKSDERRKPRERVGREDARDA